MASLKKLPHKTVERLSQYRRMLLLCLSKGKDHIFSHELAGLLHITPVQVRRDIMLIGYSGNLRKGYNIKELITLIGKIIDPEHGQKVALVGFGNLGKALIRYFSGRRTKLAIVAAFDIDSNKVNRMYDEVKCYHIDQLSEIIKEKNISIAVITVPVSEAADVAKKLVKAGIKGILNYSPQPLNVSKNIYLEEYDMITSLEKVAYFSKHSR